MADNIMLGTYSELALSGATLVNQIQFTLQQVSSGIGMGIVVLASQYWGKRATGTDKENYFYGCETRIFGGRSVFRRCCDRAGGTAVSVYRRYGGHTGRG